MPPSRTARSDRNPDIDLVIRAALNGQDLETAWKDLGEPTGWANIRKHYRKALQDKVSSSAQDPSPSASSSPARGKRKAAGDAAGHGDADDIVAEGPDKVDPDAAHDDAREVERGADVRQ